MTSANARNYKMIQNAFFMHQSRDSFLNAWETNKRITVTRNTISVLLWNTDATVVLEVRQSIELASLWGPGHHLSIIYLAVSYPVCRFLLLFLVWNRRSQGVPVLVKVNMGESEWCGWMDGEDGKMSGGKINSSLVCVKLVIAWFIGMGIEDGSTVWHTCQATFFSSLNWLVISLV